MGAWSNKGLVLENRGKYEDAIRCYDVAIQINSEITQTWQNKAIALDALGRYGEALQCYDIALQLDPTNGEIIYLRNLLLERIVESDPKDARGWLDKGNTLYALNKYDEAIKAYDTAIEIDRKYSTAWSNKGVVFGDQGKYNEALQAYDEAVSLDPNNAIAWYNKGLALQKLGRTTEANAVIAKAKELGYTG
jgi:tetratricopeptide (TPR) repeat protein